MTGSIGPVGSRNVMRTPISAPTDQLKQLPDVEDDLPSLDVLAQLFDEARARDEFEFVSTLLRLRGMEDQGWDTLEESWSLINQVIAQIEAPVENLFKTRLLIFLYCHVTEMDDLYHIVGNLLRVIGGERYSLAPFAKGMHGYKSAATTPAAKVGRIRRWAEDAGLPEVAELLETVLVTPVRNAFFHSDYVLFSNEFRIKRGRGVQLGDLNKKIVPLEWLLPRIELTVNMILALVDLLRTHVASYQEPKVVQGRFSADGSLVEIELIVREGYGVTGFRSPPSPRDHGSTSA